MGPQLTFGLAGGAHQGSCKLHATRRQFIPSTNKQPPTFWRPILWKVGEPQPKSAVPSPVSSLPEASSYMANTFRPRLASSCRLGGMEGRTRASNGRSCCCRGQATRSLARSAPSSAAPSATLCTAQCVKQPGWSVSSPTCLARLSVHRANQVVGDTMHLQRSVSSGQ